MRNGTKATNKRIQGKNKPIAGVYLVKFGFMTYKVGCTSDKERRAKEYVRYNRKFIFFRKTDKPFELETAFRKKFSKHRIKGYNDVYKLNPIALVKLFILFYFLKP